MINDSKIMEEKFVHVDDNKIRYLESGNSKKTLVLLHGLGASAERWTAVIPIFAEHFRVVVPDLIGFGYSDKPLTDYTLDFFSNFLEKFFIASNVDRPIILGSSLGGQISAEYTSTHPQNVEKLILTSPSGVMKQATPALDAYMMAAMYPNEQNAKNAFELMEGSGEKIDEKITDGFIERMRLPNAKLAFMSTLLGLKNSNSMIKKLESISSPTLIIWGTNDPVIPIAFAGEFVSAIKNCQFYEMNTCGHTPYVQEPEKFVSYVLKFLNN